MTPLRQRMIEELRRRNYAERTITTYIAGVAAFALFHRRSPDVLGADDVRAYQLICATRRSCRSPPTTR